MLARWLQGRWFPDRPQAGLAPFLPLLPLLPLWALFVALSSWRRGFYRLGLKRIERLPVPVVVVGNLTVGGAGKTPLSLWLAQELRQRGRRPGIVSRGYGAVVESPLPVKPGSDPARYGDEPVLLATRSGAPVWVGRDRAATARAMLAAHPEVDLILCDDGLQHYRLGRDVEIAVFDGRGAGNGWRLPLGPLREPLSRLRLVDAVVFNGLRSARVERSAPTVPIFDMRLVPGYFYRLDDPDATCTVQYLRGRHLHALAGIGHPARFFATLRSLGLAVAEHAFPDHHAYSAADLDFGPDAVLLMTEKDAVKCRGLFAGEAWVLPVAAEIAPALIDVILEKISGRQTA